MTNLPENVLLLSLMVKTRPYTIDENNIITSTFTEEVSVQTLKDLKSTLEEQRDVVQDSPEKDMIVRQFNDDIYLLDCVITELESN